MLAVEGRRAGKAACRSVGRIIEPEADVKCVGWCKRSFRVEPEDLVHQDGLYFGGATPGFTDLNIRLIPGQAEIYERRIQCAGRKETAVLHREEIECQPRFHAFQV